MKRFVSILFFMTVLFFWLVTPEYVQANSLNRNEVVLKKCKSFAKQVIKENTTYIIKYDFDLKGTTVTIPNGCVLQFEGGSVYGGILKGEKMQSDDIYTPEMFGAVKMRDDNDAIQSALNICHHIQMDGEYRVFANKDNKGNASLLIPGNTHIVLNGIVNYETPSLDTYCIFMVYEASDVSISGSGKLIGDKAFHKGISGEWGHGIGLYYSKNVLIEGVECCNLWGDAIYMYYGSPVCENVTVRDVYLHDCRRQGISVTGGENIKIESFRIENIRGANPQSAIDIENHSTKPINDVTINDGVIRSCNQGVILQNKPSQDVANGSGYRAGGRLSNISITRVKSDSPCLLTHNVDFDKCESPVSIVGPCTIQNSRIKINETANVEGLDGDCLIRNCDIDRLSNQAKSPQIEVYFKDCKLSFGDAVDEYFRNANGSLFKFTDCKIFFNTAIEKHYVVGNSEFRRCVIDCFDTPYLRSRVYDSEIIVRLKGNDSRVFINRGRTEIYNSTIKILSTKDIPLYYLEQGEGRENLIIEGATIMDVSAKRKRVIDKTSGSKTVRDKGTKYQISK